MRITVFGAGAVGGVVGAHLIQAGHEVTFVEVNRAHREAIGQGGLRVSGAASLLVRPRVLSPEEVAEPLRAVFLAVKSRHTLDALAVIAPRLRRDGFVLSLQNGLEEWRIAEVVSEARTVGAFLTFGGHYEGPGEVVYGGPGSFRVGELDGSTTPRVTRLAATLAAFHPVEVTDNIAGYLWAKEALSAFYFATALVDADVPEIIGRLEYRPALGRLVAEVVAVARACGARCEVVDGFDPNVFHDRSGDADGSWERLLGYWANHSSKRTGIWRDLVVHRRPTEVGSLMVPIVERARAREIETRRLECVVRLVQEAESGQRGLGWGNLDELLEADGGVA